jgi:hypothetical protein
MFNISQYVTISQDSFYNVNANQELDSGDILNYYYNLSLFFFVSTLYLYGIYYVSCCSSRYYRNLYDFEDGDEDEDEQDDNNDNSNKTKKEIAYQMKWFEEFDEMGEEGDDEQEEEELTEEFVNNLSLNTITETTPRGDVLMYYSSKLGTFVYHSHTKEIPYNYLETVARKYVIEYNCKKLYIDIRKEYEKGVQKYKEIKAKEEKNAADGGVDEAKEKENKKKQIFANFKTYNRKGEVHNKQKDKIYILKEQANRYSYRGKIEEYSEAKVESCLDKKVLEGMGDKRSEEEKRVNDIDFASFKKMNMNTN